VLTDLEPASCRKEIDKDDPNETPYLVCPGVGGYSLIVRRVESGRHSIDVVNPSQEIAPLKYQEVVTRHMSNVGSRAEWRVATKDSKQVPVAVIIPLEAREDVGEPEKVTQTYLAVAKITADETCVTDRIPAGSRSETEVRSAADSSHDRPCLAPQPPAAAAVAPAR
jgi:hypothetical protein